MKIEELRMRNCGRHCLLFVLHLSFFMLHSISAAYAGDIDVARQALRDGLWEVARTHARKADGDLAKIVVLESFAREHKWSDVLSTVEAYGKSEVPEFAYYKAAALYRTGEHDAARRLLESTDFSRGVIAADASLLHAAVLRREGYVDAALSKLEASGGGADSKMVSAAIHKSRGEDAEAEALWREVVAMTNAPESAVSIAAANLADVAALRRVVSESTDPDVVRFAGIQLGMLLVREKGSFSEGASIIRRIAKDSPDFRGAKEAFLSLADVELSRGDYAVCIQTYREAMETWPETAKEASVRLGIGWALAETGRNEEALTEFSIALAMSADDETKALAMVKSGDVLANLGKREESMSRYREALARYSDTVAARKVKEMVSVRELEQKGYDAFAAYRFDDARTIFAEVAKRDSSLAPRMAYYDMVCLYGLNQDAAAEKKAAEISSSSEDRRVRFDASMWLAKYLYNRGRYREAEAGFSTCADRAEDPSVASEPLLWATRAAFAAGDFQKTVQNATRLDSTCPGTRSSVEGMLLQAESLIELARFDESILVAERVSIAAEADATLRLRAQLLRADALFAMGADDPVRYRQALEAYTALRSGEKLSPSVKIRLSYKLAKTLERLKRMDQAIDEYYSRVVLAYRDGRAEGIPYDDDARAAFSRAAFRLAEEYESRGSDAQAVAVLRLVVTASVPASAEAEKRIERIHRKGNIL